MYMIISLGSFPYCGCKSGLSLGFGPVKDRYLYRFYGNDRLDFLFNGLVSIKQLKTNSLALYCKHFLPKSPVTDTVLTPGLEKNTVTVTNM